MGREIYFANMILIVQVNCIFFLWQGRDFESVYTNHKYTRSERAMLASHDSFDYLPSHSCVYREWLQRQPARYTYTPHDVRDVIKQSCICVVYYGQRFDVCTI